MLTTLAIVAVGTARVTFESLLREMTDPAALSTWPSPIYRSLQATSYNRESVRRNEAGWFADSDGVGFIREEKHGGETTYVLMEHAGRGCITKMWTPFFYYDFNDRVGPNVQIELDGQVVFNESLIKLVTGKGSVPPPWAAFSARAGNLYLPMPFAKSARVTMKSKPFYFSVNYRAYEPSVRVEAFKREVLTAPGSLFKATAQRLAPQPAALDKKARTISLKPGSSVMLGLPKGAHAVKDLVIAVPEAVGHPQLLRSLVLSTLFDKIQTVSCPIGDFFSNTDGIKPYTTVTRSVSAGGVMRSRWWMPYRKSGSVAITNSGRETVTLSVSVETRPEPWTKNSMHFYARWRPDDIVAGTPFQDWNFVDIKGQGVYVGDSWTVVNPRPNSWWGEGDEKVYIDGDWDRGFPSHFGTGSEDYYGWAGGVYPDKNDEFSAPFLANVKVGALDGHTQGTNILTRTRGLDAVPFNRRLRFDMEASFGTDMREKWDLLGYSVVTFFYAKPGAVHNRPAASKLLRSLITPEELQERAAKVKSGMAVGTHPSR